jgi:MscS family membrane protein
MAEESSLDIDVEKMPTDTISPDLEEIPGYSEVVERAGEFFSLGERYEWMIEVFAILMLTAVFSFVAGMVLRIITKAMTKTQSEWDDIFVESVRVPLKMVIWIVGVFYAIEAAYSAENSEVMLLLSNGRDVAIVFMFAWAMTRYINAGMDYYIKRQKRRGKNYDYTAVNAITKLLKIAVALSAFLIGLQSLGVSVSGVLAAGGIGGIAIGFAAKDMLANFFGAFIIYFDKPFKVGDWIRSPDQEIEGTVEDIGWRITTIRTFDMRPLYVPNSVFSNISVETPSRMTHRRIYETVFAMTIWA